MFTRDLLFFTLLHDKIAVIIDREARKYPRRSYVIEILIMSED